MIYTLTLNPAVDRELTVDEIVYDTVLRASSWRVDCGGKGLNVARMMKSLGHDCVAMSFAAGKAGEMLEEKLKQLGISTDFIWVNGETRTNISIVTQESSRYMKINEPGPTIAEYDIKKLFRKISGLASEGDLWVLAGSLPPGVHGGIYAELIGIIRSAGGDVFLDTSGEALKLGCKAGPVFVKPNAEEAQELTGMPVDTVAGIAKAADAIRGFGPENVVISMGKDGAVLADGEKIWLAEAPEIIEKNPIGAGDSMVAGIVWGCSLGDSMADALKRGVACGASTASLSGTEVGSLEQVTGLMKQVRLTEI